MATLLEWSEPPAPTTVGATVGLDTLDPWGDVITFDQDAGSTCYARWDHSYVTQQAVRFYFTTPTSWASATYSIAWGQDTTSGNAVCWRVWVRGSGQPGRIGLAGLGGSSVQDSPLDTLELDTMYRVEVLVDEANGTGRMAVFEGHDTAPLWDMGSMAAGSFGSGCDRLVVGQPAASPTVAHWVATDIAATDLLEFIGPSVLPGPGIVAQWADGAGDAPSSTTGLITYPGNAMRMAPDPDGDGRANVRWNAGETVSSGLAARCYFRYEGTAWADATIELFSCAAEGGAFPWRVQISGPQLGGAGRLKVVNGDSEIVAQEDMLAVPVGDWRRIEVRWTVAGLLTVTLFNRFEQVYVTLTASLPLTDYTAIQVGHWRGTPVPPPLNINQLLWSSDPAETLGEVAGVIVDPQDVAGLYLWAGGQLIRLAGAAP